MKSKALRISLVSLAAVIVIAAIIVVGVMIRRSLVGERSEYHNTRLAEFIEENKTVDKCDILFLGDSLTDGYNYNIPYPEYFSLNRGIGGDRTDDLIDMLEEAVYAVNPELVVLLIGGNDVLAGRSDGYILDNIEYIIDKIQKNTDAKILVQSFYPLGGEWAEKGARMRTLNPCVELLCAEKGCYFIDMYTPLAESPDGDFKPEYTAEGVHLSDAGRKVVVETLKPVIYDIVRAR